MNKNPSNTHALLLCVHVCCMYVNMSICIQRGGVATSGSDNLVGGCMQGENFAVGGEKFEGDDTEAPHV